VLFNHLVEDWFTQGMGIDYADFIGRRRARPPCGWSATFAPSAAWART
jgi:hypothetical protein